MRGRSMLLLAIAACGSGRRPQLYPAGSDKDDGYGDLAQQSAHLTTGEGSDAHLFAPRRHRRRDGEPYGGNPYGGATYGDPYGSSGDLPSLVPSARGIGTRASRYSATSGLTQRSRSAVAPFAKLTASQNSVVTNSVG